MTIFRLFLLLVFAISSFSARTIAQTASTDIIFNGFQACGGCTACGADYWCFNSPGSWCGNTGPSGSQPFSDPVPPGNIVTSVSVDYYSAGWDGRMISGIDNSYGTYFYIINVTDGHNMRHEESGTLNLIR